MEDAINNIRYITGYLIKISLSIINLTDKASQKSISDL